MIEELKAAAPSLPIELSFVPARAPKEFDVAFAGMSQAHAQALSVLEGSLFLLQADEVIR